MDYLGFIKNFNIRIPLKDEFQYYIDTLSKSPEYSDLKDKLELWKNYENSLPEGVSPKYDNSQTEINAVEYFKELIGESVKEFAETKSSTFSLMNFTPEHNNFYVSFDTKQGNWTVIRKALNKDLVDWEDYVQEELNFHPILAKSKGLRQAILGRVCSTKHYTKILKSFTQSNLDLLDSVGLTERIKGIKEEEVFIHIGEELDSDIVNKLKDIEWGLPTKATLCKYEKVENFGKHIVLEHHYDFDTLEFKYTRMMHNGGDGNRFYLNFKSLILNEEVEPRDLNTRKDGIPFQYCGENYNEQTEYQWIERWVKPLCVNKHSMGDPEYQYYYIGDGNGGIYASVNLKTFTITFKDDSYKMCKTLEEADKFIRKSYLRKVKSFFNI
jgi:hypothetical protein